MPFANPPRRQNRSAIGAMIEVSAAACEGRLRRVGPMRIARVLWISVLATGIFGRFAGAGGSDFVFLEDDGLVRQDGASAHVHDTDVIENEEVVRRSRLRPERCDEKRENKKSEDRATNEREAMVEHAPDSSWFG